MALTDLSKLVEAIEQFIYDLAESFREKRWTKIFSRLSAVFALFLSPPAVEYGLKFLGFGAPQWYSYQVWGIVTASFFVAALLGALLTKKHQEPEITTASTSIIKGLLPYTKEDAQWFTKLQRGSILQECMSFCLGSDSSFAIFSGESGTGKTSFLQAGLLPNLEQQGQRPIYVKLTDGQPLSSIRQALNIQVDESTIDNNQSLLELLQQTTQNDNRPIVLILDQFEQFFAHNKDKLSRQPFIQQMAEWNKQSRSLPIKILISIRGDFANRMNELQKEMRYALTPHNNLSLGKFEPQEAESVIKVIAKEAKIELDESFIKELTEHELADRKDSTISPVDVQILSWMIDGQKNSEERAFNRKAFQKIGGVDGLLGRFLDRELEAIKTDTRLRQAAIKVMLALTDQYIRAGAMSLKDLKEKLKGVIPEGDIEKAVSWLVRGDVRLTLPIQGKRDIRYELTHERIILPLRRLAFKEIKGVQEAEQTLERRVNEWLGNNRASRYLLGWREWRLIEQQRPYLDWGPKRKHKELLLSRTQKRWRIRMLGFCGVIMLIAGVSIGHNIWLNSEAGQIHQNKRDLLIWSEEIDDHFVLKQVVDALVDSGMFEQAYKVADNMTLRGPQAMALSTIAKAIQKTNIELSTELFEQAIKNAKGIRETHFKVGILTSIAVDIRNKDTNQSIELLEQAFESMRQVKGPLDEDLAWQDFAEKLAKMQIHQSPKLLKQAIEVAQETHSPTAKATALSALAGAIAKTDAEQSVSLLGEAIDIMKDGYPPYPHIGGKAWPAIAGALAKIDVKQSPKLWEEAIEAVKYPDSPWMESIALSDIAAGISKIDAEQSKRIFKHAIDLAKTYADVFDPDEFQPTNRLGYIAKTIANVAISQQSIELSNLACETAEAIHYPDWKTSTLSTVAGIIAKLDPERSNNLLNQALQVMEQVDNHYDKASLQSQIAGDLAKLAVAKQSRELLKQAIEIVNRINDYDVFRPITYDGRYDTKVGALRIIAMAAVKLKDLRLARSLVFTNRDNKEKIIALSLVLKTWANSKVPALVENNEEELKTQIFSMLMES